MTLPGSAIMHLRTVAGLSSSIYLLGVFAMLVVVLRVEVFLTRRTPRSAVFEVTALRSGTHNHPHLCFPLAQRQHLIFCGSMPGNVHTSSVHTHTSPLDF